LKWGKIHWIGRIVIYLAKGGGSSSESCVGEEIEIELSISRYEILSETFALNAFLPDSVVPRI